MELSLSPEIVLFHILPKLPAKSLLRFKCVCKQWQSFLTSPLFANIHLHHVTTTICHEKILLFLNGSRNYHTMDCEDGLIAMPRCYPFEGHPSFIATTVNGLVLVNIRETFGDFTNMILWNPLTGEYKTISKPIDTKCYYVRSPALELYHTCSDDDYKILSITTDGNVYIYSLKSDSWRKLESTPYYPGRIPYADDDINLLDEKLLFLSSHGKRNMITRLDLKTEKFTQIAVPPSCRPGETKLAVVRGCIQLTVFNRAQGLPGTWIIEMWQMNGRDGDWTKMVNISYSFNHNPMHLMIKRHHMRLLCLMRNGNFIGYDENAICKVDLEKKIEDNLCSNPNVVILPRIYIETFVSPNKHIS